MRDKNGKLDLIDTWWNVNCRWVRAVNVCHFRFNRYIVECKFKYIVHSLVIATRFNRYIVECKCVEMDKNVIPYLRFNRYIVECKLRMWVLVLHSSLI